MFKVMVTVDSKDYVFCGEYKDKTLKEATAFAKTVLEKHVPSEYSWKYRTERVLEVSVAYTEGDIQVETVYARRFAADEVQSVECTDREATEPVVTLSETADQ